MAAIGDAWADGAWIEASWISGAWAAVVAAVTTVLRAHKLLAQRVVRSRPGSLQRRR